MRMTDTMEVLQVMDRQAIKPAHREHVMAYIWDHLSDFLSRLSTLARPETLFNEAPCDIEMWSAEDIVRTYRWTIEKVG